MKARSFTHSLSSFVRRSGLHTLAACAWAAALCLALAPAHAQAPQTPAAPARGAVQKDFGKIPLSFEPNRGQAASQSDFVARGPGYALSLNGNRAVLSTNAGAASRSTLTMQIVGAHKVAGAGEQPLQGTANYFIGDDQSKWKSALPTYGRVAYPSIYRGIDLVYYGNQRELEYDFVVAAGADPSTIALKFTGAHARLDSRGDLVLATANGETRFHKPVVYQMNEGRRTPVEGSYTLASNQVHFALGAYDHARPLVIDPVLSYLTYVGGSTDDTVVGMAVDSAGSVYLVGTTNSVDFPVRNAYKATDPNTIAPSNPLAIFVSKLNATGTALVYSTYLGSSEYSNGSGIAVDSSGNAYVAGYTSYGNYPVTAGAYQTICGANNYIPAGSSTAVRINGCVGSGQADQNAVLTKLDPTGTTLVYSTYLGGGNGNRINAIAVNPAGEAWVTGVTNAVCPGPYNPNGSGYQSYFCIAATANASEVTNSNARGDTYAFVVKFNAQGTGLLYSTTLGNHNPAGHYTSGIQARAIALDTAGNAYVTGNMDSNYFITTTTGAFQTSPVSNALPAFVAKFNPAGTSATSLAYSTYLSGSTASNDNATGIAVDGSGNAVVTGYTNSCTFPTTAGAFSTIPGGYVSQNTCAGGFLSKLNATGSGLVWSTYTGANGGNGRNNDDNDAVAIGPDGSVYVTGDEGGVALSPTVNPILVQSESHFTYIKQFKSDGSAVTFSSAIGGTADATSIPAAIFVDAANNIYLAGSTNSSTYPTTTGAFQKNSANPGLNYNDGFVAKIAPVIASTTSLTIPTGVIAGQPATFSAKVAGPTGTTAIPTGVITFSSGTTTLGTATLNGTGTATYTATSLNATTYTVVASYPGDANFSASASTSQALVVTPATATVTLTAPATAVTGAPVTLSVKVTGSGPTPSGTVTFKDGSTVLSTSTLAAGAASYTTSSLAPGTHTITASYGGDAIFASATSATATVNITVPPAISFAASPSSLTVTHGTSGTVTFTGTPVGGYTGTVSFACGTLPAAATCTFAPATLNFTGTNTAQTSTLTFSTLSPMGRREAGALGSRFMAMTLALLLLPLGKMRRRLNALQRAAVLSLVVFAGALGMASLTGCGSGSPTAAATTPPGSYTVPVVITASGATSTINLNITVQ